MRSKADETCYSRNINLSLQKKNVCSSQMTIRTERTNRTDRTNRRTRTNGEEWGVWKI